MCETLNPFSEIDWMCLLPLILITIDIKTFCTVYVSASLQRTWLIILTVLSVHSETRTCHTDSTAMFIYTDVYFWDELRILRKKLAFAGNLCCFAVSTDCLFRMIPVKLLKKNFLKHLFHVENITNQVNFIHHWRLKLIYCYRNFKKIGIFYNLYPAMYL